MTIRFHEGDIGATDAARYTADIAIDTETLGLNPHRDRLCLVQLSPGDGSADLVRIAPNQAEAANLKALLEDRTKTKVFHFARFDLAVLIRAFGTSCEPLFCTKIASRLTRTYTDRHGLRDNLREVLDIDISKQQQSSDWGAEALSSAQLEYAAGDVLHLHALRDKLAARLQREGRAGLAEACFRFLPARARLDLAGWPDTDIFAHG